MLWLICCLESLKHLRLRDLKLFGQLVSLSCVLFFFLDTRMVLIEEFLLIELTHSLILGLGPWMSLLCFIEFHLILPNSSLILLIDKHVYLRRLVLEFFINTPIHLHSAIHIVDYTVLRGYSLLVEFGSILLLCIPEIITSIALQLKARVLLFVHLLSEPLLSLQILNSLFGFLFFALKFDNSVLNWSFLIFLVLSIYDGIHHNILLLLSSNRAHTRW